MCKEKKNWTILIHWNVNFQAPSTYVRDTKISKPDFEGLVSRSTQIRFYIDRKRYTERTLKLSCVSSFPGIDVQIVNKTVILNNQEAEVVNNQKFYWNSSTRTSAYNLISYYYILLIVLTVVRFII